MQAKLVERLDRVQRRVRVRLLVGERDLDIVLGLVQRPAAGRRVLRCVGCVLRCISLRSTILYVIRPVCFPRDIREDPVETRREALDRIALTHGKR